ncbi:Putative LysR type transcriptional regulator (plasmid) [Cupriavidus necator]|uniref:LysR family transcriptional regulator n=1 Tax=Cupriavidus necator TaxID=106590 RepID=A0A1U9V371_CUPNE|nr:LysR family transcriptional regulator [Cupriavidus necator]AQV99343.1 LysR family transcriptional regulator [Cupriavidus necator]
MDLKQIQYFIALFEDGSVTRAAKRLHIVQPALSMQIARLEEELNQKLFERGAHGMSPTAAGRQMYRLFLPIMRDITHAREQLVQRDEVVSGNITIGLIASIAEGALAEALTSFRMRYPQVEVTVADGYSTTLIDWVAGGQLDVAIINKPRAQLSLDSRPLLDEEMVLATSAAHGPDLPGSVQLASLPAVELVLPTKRHGLRGVLDSAAHQLDMMLTPKYEIDALGTIVKLVASTNMATILPRIAVQRAVDRGTLRVHAILAPRLIRHIVRISHPRRPLSTAAEALVRIIASEIQRTSDAATPAGSQDLNKEKME